MDQRRLDTMMSVECEAYASDFEIPPFMQQHPIFAGICDMKMGDSAVANTRLNSKERVSIGHDGSCLADAILCRNMRGNLALRIVFRQGIKEELGLGPRSHASLFLRCGEMMVSMDLRVLKKLRDFAKHEKNQSRERKKDASRVDAPLQWKCHGTVKVAGDQLHAFVSSQGPLPVLGQQSRAPFQVFGQHVAVCCHPKLVVKPADKKEGMYEIIVKCDAKDAMDVHVKVKADGVELNISRSLCSLCPEGWRIVLDDLPACDRLTIAANGDTLCFKVSGDIFAVIRGRASPFQRDSASSNAGVITLRALGLSPRPLAPKKPNALWTIQSSKSSGSSSSSTSKTLGKRKSSINSEPREETEKWRRTDMLPVALLAPVAPLTVAPSHWQLPTASNFSRSVRSDTDHMDDVSDTSTCEEESLVLPPLEFEWPEDDGCSDTSAASPTLAAVPQDLGIEQDLSYPFTLPMDPEPMYPDALLVCQPFI